MEAEAKVATVDDLKAAYNKWAEIFFTKMHPLTHDQGIALINMTFAELEKQKLKEVFTESFAYKVCKGRAEYLGFEWDEEKSPFACVLIGLGLSESPGEIVMILSALRSKTNKLTIQDLGESFYIGIPKKEDLSKLWDEQKGYKLGIPNCDNMLDMISSGMFNG